LYAATQSAVVFRSGTTASNQGLTLAHLKAQLEDLRESIAHIRAQLEHLRDTLTGNLGCMGDKLSSSRAEMGKVSSS
jgi:hypothetical protein